MAFPFCADFFFLALFQVLFSLPLLLHPPLHEVPEPYGVCQSLAKTRLEFVQKEEEQPSREVGPCE